MNRVVVFLLFLTTYSFATEPKHYGMIITGGGDKNSNHIRYLKNGVGYFGALNKCGVDRGNMTVLASDGTNPGNDLHVDGVIKDPTGILSSMPYSSDTIVNSPTSYKFDNITDVDGPATTSEIKSKLKELESKMKKGDHLALYINDHGTHQVQQTVAADGTVLKTKSIPAISLWGETITVPEFKTLLRNLSYKGVKTQVVSSMCYSGALLDLTDENTCVFTSTAKNVVNHSNTYNNEYMDGFSAKLSDCNSSFLDAHKYGAAADSNGNKPKTSLDWFFDEHMAKKYKKDIAECKKNAIDEMQDIHTFVASSTKAVAKGVMEVTLAQKLQATQEQKMINDRITELNTEKAELQKKIDTKTDAYLKSFYEKDIRHIDEKVAFLSRKKVVPGIKLSNEKLLLLSKADSYDMNIFLGTTDCMTHKIGQND